jgi:hypothetical protein
MSERGIEFCKGISIALVVVGVLSLAWMAIAEPANTATAKTAAAGADAKAKADDAKRYIRVTHDARGKPLAMETSIVRLVPKGDDRQGLAVDLISAVHVADAGYYEKLNKRFADYDVVLYELVAPEGTVIPQGGLDRNRNALSSVQNGIKDLLELEYQLTGIDYTKKNFVHADLSPEEFSESMKNKGESFWTIFLRLMAAGMAQQASNRGNTSEIDLLMALFDPERALKLKRIMADQFSDMDTMMLAFNGPDGSTLITERNKAALKVLAREIDAGRKKIAIFYGGGHMPDMEQQAGDQFNLKRDSQQWLEAWNLRDKK